jgi:hypothetical protein
MLHQDRVVQRDVGCSMDDWVDSDNQVRGGLHRGNKVNRRSRVRGGCSPTEFVHRRTTPAPIP